MPARKPSNVAGLVNGNALAIEVAVVNGDIYVRNGAIVEKRVVGGVVRDVGGPGDLA